MMSSPAIVLQVDTLAESAYVSLRVAEVARTANAETIVTDNRRHFVSTLRYGMRVETPAEFLVSKGLK